MRILKDKFLRYLAVGAAALTPSLLLADPATPIPAPSQVQTHIRLDVKENTKEVHFINTNNDPNIFTKTYVLKNADPYELRPYIRSAVQSYQVDPLSGNYVAGTGAGKIEAVKYMDGTGVLIVSAEEYRFRKQPNGCMGIDELINSLDQPKITSSSGHVYTLYIPKYLSALALKNLLTNVGAGATSNDPYELDQGKDRMRVDSELNALFLSAPNYLFKNVQDMINLYDVPTAEALVEYKIYELDSENDGKLGADFQAWKNGPGSDLFAIGGRWSNGGDFANMQPNSRSYINKSHTEFINFSPKWNTKYLDFLSSKGKAKVVTSGTLSLVNNLEGAITSTTKLANLQDGSAIPSNTSINQYIRLTDANWDSGVALPLTVANPYANAMYNDYRINNAVDEHGETIRILQVDGATAVGAQIDFMITKSTVGTETYYYMEISPVDGNGTEVNAYFWNTTRGINLGKKVKAYDVTLQRASSVSTDGIDSQAAGSIVGTINWVTQTNWSTDRSFTISKDVQRNSASNSYGFTLTMKPVICGNATTLSVNMTNTNLLGFKDNGMPRTSRSEISTKVMASNSGKEFVIGGLEKQAVVKSVDKVPYLGDIPLIGWALSSESDTIKKSQLVAVVNVTPVLPDTKVPEKIATQIIEAKGKIDDAGIKIGGKIIEPDFGFDQFLFDSEKKGFDPLP